jgi:hypothetical protein
MVGASRQWVTMTLDRFQSDGLIQIGRCRTIIFDIDALRSYRAEPDRKDRTGRRRTAPDCIVELPEAL